MSFPVDVPNPNQDNVYYSIPALKAELLNWFDVDKIKVIEEKYKDYYLPTFVFDPAGAPTVYNLDVYPKDGQKESIQFDQTGTIIDELKLPRPQVKPPELGFLGEKLNDDAFPCVLDPKFYVNTLLKEPNDMEFEQEDSSISLDLLVSTKYQDDKSLPEKVQNYAILKNLLLGQLKILPEEELSLYKDQYQEVLNTIDQFLTSVQDVSTGQSNSLDALKYGNFYKDVYNQLDEMTQRKRGLRGTQMILGQALSDLGNVISSDGRDRFKIRIGTTRNDSTLRTQTFDGTRKTLIKNKWGHTIWPSFLKVLQDEGVIDTPSNLAKPRGALRKLGADFEAITKYDGTPVFAVEGKPQEWYYSNLKKSVSGEETNWDGLEDFIDIFEGTINKYIEKATLDTLGGQHLLVDQAILKSILKLCMTNIDVNEYAPTMENGENFFNIIGRPSSLGPSGTSPYPSKDTIDIEDYVVQPYTNNAFLCYHALVALVHRVPAGDPSMEFLVNNIREPESNLDDVIDLVRLINYDGETVEDLYDIIRPYVSKTLVELLHLHKKGESFPLYEEVVLIPKELDIPSGERTFFGWNLKLMRHTLEQFVLQDAQSTKKNYDLLGTDYPNAVHSRRSGNRRSDEGRMIYRQLPTVYRNMGYSSADNRGRRDATTNIRNKEVNFGIGKGNRDVLEFWKQRQYSMPYFWASMTSIWRALAVETWKNLITSVNEILGTEINYTNEEILEKFDHEGLWLRIKQIFLELRGDSTLAPVPFVSPDGNLSFTNNSDDGFRYINDEVNQNTPGQSTRVMMQEFARFVSLVSEFSSVQVVETHDPVEFDFATYLPPQGLTQPTNLNFANSHGGGGQYLDPTFEPYYDKLQYTPHELAKEELIKKHQLPVVGNVPDNFIQRYKIFLERSTGLYRHTLMFDHIVKSLREIKTFVGGFSVPERIQAAIDNDQIDLSRDLDNPQALVDQVDAYRNRYEANEFGLGKRWDWNLDPQAIETAAKDEEWLYVQVLGLKRECFNDGPVTLVPQYMTSEALINIDEASITVTSYPDGSDFDQRSDLLLKWLHMSSGLDLCELTFSRDTEMIYSEELQESESEVFPWKKDDFEDGKPKKPLETIYNMSPWLFSQNMFNDICIPNTYHRVVGCVITKKQLESSGIGLETVDGSIDDIIGSIRWIKI